MILCHCNFYSKTLNNHVDVNVLIPSIPDNDCFFHSLDEVYKERKIPVLYLLHGALDDYTMWLRHTNIERYAEEAGMAVVMPSGQNGFYSNAVYGLNYFDYITEELPRFVEYTFPVSHNRENRYIAGPSMGGYGASKCGLGRPDRYRAFGDFSGAVDPQKLEPLMVQMGFGFFRYDLIFDGSDKVTGSKDDLKIMVEKCSEYSEKPYAFVACGKDDTNNYSMNYKLYEKLKSCGFETEFFGGNGLHDWEYWDKCVKEFIKVTKSL
jgi:putative tributyrin esterase